MKRMLTALLALTLAVSALAAGPKTPEKAPTGVVKKTPVVVIVDMSRIYKESKISKQIETDFRTWNESLRATFQKKLADLRGKQAALKKNEATLSKEEKAKEQKAIDAAQKDLSSLQMKARQEFQKRQKAAEDKLHNVLDPLLDKLGKEYGWDVILNKGAKDLVWNSGAVDETALILKRLDAATPDTAPPKAAAGKEAKPQPKKP